MESDRGLTLLKQAYIEGYLDPKEASVSDQKWLRKTQWIIEWLKNKNENEVRKLQHELNCALLDYFTGDRAIDLHWEQAIDIQNRVKKTTMPWVEIEEAKLSRKSFSEMFETWKKIFGDPKDPEVDDKINRTARALLEMAAKN